MVVVWPGVSLATAEVYRAFDGLPGRVDAGGRGPYPPRPSAPARRGHSRGLGGAGPKRSRADRHRVSVPAIALLRAALLGAGALAAAMSGSGAAVYGVFESEERRDEALGRLPLAGAERAFATMTQASPRGA